tara:strand:- start:953 stop:1294 length:342 start_codon:yes stop_codon:yes gene_type:complete
MNNQDFNTIVFNSTQNKETNQNKEITKYISQKENNPETTKIEAPKKLGMLISQARTTKGFNQKQLSSQLGISQILLSRWESEKEIPTNLQIVNIEKKLGIKLPRTKKIKININ